MKVKICDKWGIEPDQQKYADFEKRLQRAVFDAYEEQRRRTSEAWCRLDNVPYCVC